MHIYWVWGDKRREQTGGEIFVSKIHDYIREQNNIEIIYPTDNDLQILCKSRGSFTINLYFFKRIRRLQHNTIIVGSENNYYAFFLTNWLIKLFRRDIRFIINTQQIPKPLSREIIYKTKRNLMLFFYLHSADVIIVNSNYLKNYLTKLFMISSRKINIVHPAGNVIPRTVEANSTRESGYLRILSVGNIRYIKGQKVLIEAFNKLKNNKFKAHLVGGTKDRLYRDELYRLISQYGMKDHVRLCGFLDKSALYDLYSKADIFVLPSLYEAYGMVLHEAMAFGLPIIASDVGGVSELISDGKEGFLVHPGDPEALSERLHKLLTNPKIRKEMSEKGKTRYSKLPNWDEVCRHFHQPLLKLS